MSWGPSSASTGGEQRGKKLQAEKWLLLLLSRAGTPSPLLSQGFLDIPVLPHVLPEKAFIPIKA